LCFAGIRRGLGSLLRRRELRLKGLERGRGERGVGGEVGRRVCGTSSRGLLCCRFRFRLIVRPIVSWRQKYETKGYTIDICLYSSRNPRSNKAFENRKRQRRTAGRSYRRVQRLAYINTLRPTNGTDYASRTHHTSSSHNTLESKHTRPPPCSPQRLSPSRPAKSAMALNQLTTPVTRQDHNQHRSRAYGLYRIVNGHINWVWFRRLQAHASECSTAFTVPLTSLAPDEVTAQAALAPKREVRF
jgi:hypothetical protein